MLWQTGTVQNCKTDNSVTKSTDSLCSFCQTAFPHYFWHVRVEYIFCFVEICGSVTERHVDISSFTMNMDVAGFLETSV